MTRFLRAACLRVRIKIVDERFTHLRLCQVYGGEDVQAVGNYERFVRNVTADQVKRTAETYLDPKLLRVAIVRGKKN